MAPWNTTKFPSTVTLKVAWADDANTVATCLSLYDKFKSEGLLVERVSGSAQAQALLTKLNTDHIGATSQAAGPYLMTPPQTIFTYYPIYTDDLAAIADWFLKNWTQTRKPNVAYLTANSASGMSIDTAEMKAYLTKIGFNFVGVQYVDTVPTSPPTTQLLWLKQNSVDLTLGFMVNPGSQPTIKEATRLGMGPSLDYKITFGFASPSHLAVFAPAMGTLGNGVVVAGSFPPLTATGNTGIDFCNALQAKYRPTAKITHVMYDAGVIEAMIQVGAFRLTLQTNTVSQLTSQKVLEQGFYMISNLDTGGLAASKITFGRGKIEGVDQVQLDQVVDGKVSNIGYYPCHHIYAVTQ